MTLIVNFWSCPVSSPVFSTLGHVPSPSPSICDWSNRRQWQWKELHRQAAGGSWSSPCWLWQAGPWGVPARNNRLPQSASRIWVRWGNALPGVWLLAMYRCIVPSICLWTFYHTLVWINLGLLRLGVVFLLLFKHLDDWHNEHSVVSKSQSGDVSDITHLIWMKVDILTWLSCFLIGQQNNQIVEFQHDQLQIL